VFTQPAANLRRVESHESTDADVRNAAITGDPDDGLAGFAEQIRHVDERG
jgi:hypothetical protein